MKWNEVDKAVFEADDAPPAFIHTSLATSSYLSCLVHRVTCIILIVDILIPLSCTLLDLLETVAL